MTRIYMAAAWRGPSLIEGEGKPRYRWFHATQCWAWMGGSANDARGYSLPMFVRIVGGRAVEL